MAEPDRIERKTGKLALARSAFLQPLEADGTAEYSSARINAPRKVKLFPNASRHISQQGDVLCIPPFRSSWRPS